MRLIAWFVGFTLVAPLQASDVDQVAREALTKLAPQATLESVREAPIEGFLELVANGEVLYLSRDGKHVFQGNLMQVDGARNLTEKSREVMRKQHIEGLAAESLISYEANQASHRVTVFTALDCGYCRRFHQGIASVLERGISVDYVLIPLAGPGTEVDATSQSVFCAADRRSALDIAMRGEPVPAAMCPSGYDAGKALARALGINRTPTFIGSGGEQLRFGSVDQLRADLDALVAAR
jgi:thiol:disulfide interchange protein DsbC